MRITSSGFILAVLGMAIANKLGGSEPADVDWFAEYEMAKDRGDVVSEGKALDLEVDAAGHALVQKSSSRMSTVKDSPLEINWPEVTMAIVESLIIEGAIAGKIDLGRNKVGNFIEDKSSKMETLNESDGAVHGVTIWTMAGWSAVVLCLLILVCAVMYFKKSIE